MRQRALIDIQMILDTRLGVLARLNPQAANKIVRSEWYHQRDTDRFDTVSDGLINIEEYRALAGKYEPETLVESLFTDYLFLLRKDIEEVFPKTDIKDITGRIQFDINVYPYKLLDSEKEVIRRAVARYLTEPGEVKVVDIAYHLLSPGSLNDNYEMMALYNYEDWLRYHEEALYKTPIREFTLFHPRIAPSGDVPKDDDVFNDPFTVAPLVLCEHLQLHPIPTSWVSWNPEVYDKLISHPDSHPHSEAVPPEQSPSD